MPTACDSQPAVDQDGKSPQVVAEEFLKVKGQKSKVKSKVAEAT